MRESEAEIGKPRMITLVVPSPHSSSCVLLSSIMFLAAGWATSISRKIAFPSFVSLMEIESNQPWRVISAHGKSHGKENQEKEWLNLTIRTR